MHMYGIPIPADWMLTADGKPTTIPDEGRMLALAAGPKGYGLALIMGTLAEPLVGGIMGCHREDGASEHFFMVLNISNFTDFDEFAAELDRGIRTVKASKTVEGVDEVYLPGEIGWRNYEMWIENGLPLHHDYLQGLEAIAEKLRV